MSFPLFTCLQKAEHKLWIFWKFLTNIYIFLTFFDILDDHGLHWSHMIRVYTGHRWSGPTLVTDEHGLHMSGSTLVTDDQSTLVRDDQGLHWSQMIRVYTGPRWSGPTLVTDEHGLHWSQMITVYTGHIWSGYTLVTDDQGLQLAETRLQSIFMIYTDFLGPVGD